MTPLALQSVRSRVEAAFKESKRGGANPTLVAVSKTKPAAMLTAAYELGQRNFGENYVQELVSKTSELPSDICWHFIGHLQSNKCRKLVAGVPNLFVVETVDSAKIARTLNRVCVDLKRNLSVLVQVNTSGEASKYGVSPADCVGLVKVVVEECPRLRFAGLMTIGDYSPTPKPDCFKRLCACRDAVEKELKIDFKDKQLSMGMSADFELAVSMGSTSVRVGSALFGARQYKAKKESSGNGKS